MVEEERGGVRKMGVDAHVSSEMLRACPPGFDLSVQVEFLFETNLVGGPFPFVPREGYIKRGH